MIYVCSNLRGNYEKYIEMIDTINLKESDTLYILGDIVDRGRDGVKILRDMMRKPNIIGLLGNHEFMALTLVRAMIRIFNKDYTESFGGDYCDRLMNWFEKGGEFTLDEFDNLTKQDRESVIKYLETLKPYHEVTVNGVDYVLVHAGIDNFDDEKSLSEYKTEDFLWNKIDDKQYFKNKVLITGHKPVNLVEEKSIYKNKNNISLDCGCGYNGKLGILCLDTMDEFYV